MRKWLIAGLVLVSLVTVPVTVMAIVGGGGSTLDLQRFKWTTTPESTTSSTFVDIAGLSGVSICAQNGETVYVMLGFKSTFNGKVRVLDNGVPMPPGPVTFTGTGADARDFTFVRTIKAGTHKFRVQWASTGGSDDLTKGSFAVQYQRGTC